MPGRYTFEEEVEYVVDVDQGGLQSFASERLTVLTDDGDRSYTTRSLPLRVWTACARLREEMHSRLIVQAWVADHLGRVICYMAI